VNRVSLNSTLPAIAALVGAMVADLAETLVDPANSGNATRRRSATTG